jgi:RNA polymerase sigma factor (sigma-70 family)|nr:MAG TPA: RNA polymerase sigma factor [Caudoviricetes sp.]
MKKIVKKQTSNCKQYFIPMEVTPETIRDFNINPADVVWAKIGSRKLKVVMIPATEEQYYAFMRPLWREDKRNQRAKPMVSLDKLYDETEYEMSSPVDVETDFEKKLLIKELHKALDELDEMDRIIMDLYSKGNSETEIGKVVGLSQRGINKRKHRIFEKIKVKLQAFR